MSTAYKQLITHASQTLQRVSDTPQLDAEGLLSQVIQQNRTYLYTWPDKVVTDAELEQFDALLQRRAQGEPVAYITGTREFWSMQLVVNPHTLIPRPETELLVEKILELTRENTAASILELGTGSGAIALALAHELPSASILATELNPNTLDVAQHNVIIQGHRNVRLLESDWFSALSLCWFDVIVSNPPYIAEGDAHLTEGDVRFEPPLALTAGPEGLDAIRHICHEAPNWLLPGGWLLLEHGYDQATKVQTLMQQAGLVNSHTFQDLAGHGRVTTGQLPEC